MRKQAQIQNLNAILLTFSHEVNLFIESKLQKSKNFKTFKAGHKLGKRHEQGGLLWHAHTSYEFLWISTKTMQ